MGKGRGKRGKPKMPAPARGRGAPPRLGAQPRSPPKGAHPFLFGWASGETTGLQPKGSRGGTARFVPSVQRPGKLLSPQSPFHRPPGHFLA